MAECEYIEACRMAYGGEGCKPACDLGLPCHLYERKVDREALLALADELEAQQANKGIRQVGPYMQPGEAARRIREALGVSE